MLIHNVIAQLKKTNPESWEEPDGKPFVALAHPPGSLIAMEFEQERRRQQREDPAAEMRTGTVLLPSMDRVFRTGRTGMLFECEEVEPDDRNRTDKPAS